MTNWITVSKRILKLSASYGLWKWGMISGEPIIMLVGVLFGMSEILEVVEDVRG